MPTSTPQSSISIVVDPNLKTIKIDGFAPSFTGSTRQNEWAVQIAQQAINQLAALTTADMRHRKLISDGHNWTLADIEVIKEHVGNVAATAVKAAQHRRYAGWWINNRQYGGSLFKMAWK